MYKGSPLEYIYHSLFIYFMYQISVVIWSAGITLSQETRTDEYLDSTIYYDTVVP